MRVYEQILLHLYLDERHSGKKRWWANDTLTHLLHRLVLDVGAEVEWGRGPRWCELDGPSCSGMGLWAEQQVGWLGQRGICDKNDIRKS